MAKRKLNPQQIEFANEYIKSKNAYQSAIKAGYSKAYAKNASKKMLGNGGIQKYIHQKTINAQINADVTTEQVIVNLLKIAAGLPQSDRSITYDNMENKLISDRTYTQPAKSKDQVAAAQLVLQMAGKLKADDGNLTNAKIRKANAEAKIAEIRAESLKNGDDDTAAMLTALVKTLRGGANDDSKSK